MRKTAAPASPEATKLIIRRDQSCHGSKKLGYWHHKDCRPGRPLCAAMRTIRETRRVCGCDAYFFPHRAGSGRCGDVMKQWAHDYGMSVDDVRALCSA